MIRPVNDRERTSSDIIEARFFNTTVKKHKKRTVSRSRYADDNPLLTAGVILFSFVIMMFLFLGYATSAKGESLEDNSSNIGKAKPEVVKTQDTETLNNNETDEKVAKDTNSTPNSDNQSNYFDITQTSIEFADVDVKRFHKPHRTPENPQPRNNNIEKRLSANNLPSE